MMTVVTQMDSHIFMRKDFFRDFFFKTQLKVSYNLVLLLKMLDKCEKMRILYKQYGIDAIVQNHIRMSNDDNAAFRMQMFV